MPRAIHPRGLEVAVAPPFSDNLAMRKIPDELEGWWRIVETSQWVDDDLDILGPALVSLTGQDDRLRMHCLLAELDVRPRGDGVAFTWQGAWEYDQMGGRGFAALDRDGRLVGEITIHRGDDSTFVALRTQEPDDFIPPPPSYRDKWRR